MTDQPGTGSEPLDVALAYHRAWTSNRIGDAINLVAPGIECDLPTGHMQGLDQYRPFLANFAPTVTGYDMIAALGDEQTAVLVYALHTVRVSSGLVCECFTVTDGQITRNRLIFDQTPYTAARQRS